MSRTPRHIIDARLAQLEETLKLVHVERAHLEAELERKTAGLRRIARDPGRYGAIARDALRTEPELTGFEDDLGPVPEAPTDEELDDERTSRGRDDQGSP